MKAVLLTIIAMISLVAAKPYKGNYTTCDSTVWCNSGTVCALSELTQTTSSGTGSSADSSYWEGMWVKRCIPCTYSASTNATVTESTYRTFTSDPAYTAPSGQTAATWTSSIRYITKYVCPLPRVNLTAFPDPEANKKDTGISCSSTDFKKLAIEIWESSTLIFQVVYELGAAVIPKGDVKSLVLAVKRGINAGPGAFGYVIGAAYYIALDQGVGDLVCTIAGYVYVVTNALSQVANFAA